jgi:rRNA maturation RNase YbeY
MISADIMISVDRVKDNAQHENKKFENELLRVMSHGILHCLGYKDHNEESKQEMRRKEDEALEMFHVEQNRIEDNV